MTDKPVTTPRSRLRDTIGTLDEAAMAQVTRSLSVLLGIA